MTYHATTDEDDAWLLAEIGNALATAAAADQGLIWAAPFAPVEQDAGRLWDEAWGKPVRVGMTSEQLAGLALQAVMAGGATYAAVMMIVLAMHWMGWV